MDKKENQTLDKYKRIVAEMSLFHDLGVDLIVTIRHVIPAARLYKLQNAINDYLCVFYGFLYSTSINYVKEEQVDLAKKILADIFELEDENVLVSDETVKK